MADILEPKIFLTKKAAKQVRTHRAIGIYEQMFRRNRLQGQVNPLTCVRGPLRILMGPKMTIPLKLNTDMNEICE